MKFIDKLQNIYLVLSRRERMAVILLSLLIVALSLNILSFVSNESSTGVTQESSLASENSGDSNFAVHSRMLSNRYSRGTASEGEVLVMLIVVFGLV